MLSPYAIHHLLKHFDAIDRAVTRQMVYPRPKDEEQLTGTLVDLLDEEVQKLERISYGIQELRNDLAEASEPISVDYSIETHKYSKEFEGLVTQADLGLIVRFENNYEPTLSGERSWLLQAKRAYPTSLSPTYYEAKSKFGAFKAGQHQRIESLIKFVDADFFRYLLYCPRPETLDEKSRLELAYFRGKRTSAEVFDFAYGLELWDDIRGGAKTVAAGVFVADVGTLPKCLGEVHSGIFKRATPLSWFLIQHLPARGNHSWSHDSLLDDHHDSDLVAKIVRGDVTVRDEIAKALGDKTWKGELLPAATLTVTISAGQRNVRDRFSWEDHDRNPSQRSALA